MRFRTSKLSSQLQTIFGMGNIHQDLCQWLPFRCRHTITISTTASIPGTTPVCFITLVWQIAAFKNFETTRCVTGTSACSCLVAQVRTPHTNHCGFNIVDAPACSALLLSHWQRSRIRACSFRMDSQPRKLPSKLGAFLLPSSIYQNTLMCENIMVGMRWNFNTVIMYAITLHRNAARCHSN